MTEILVLRLIHVLGGIFWVGSLLFVGLFLMPTLAGIGPAAGPVMAGMRERRLMVVMPTVALLTILSGLRLLWIASGGFAAAYFTTPRGGTFAASGAAAIVAFSIGMAFLRPAQQRMGAVGATLAQGPDEAARGELVAEMGRLQRRTATLNRIIIVLLVLAAAGMAVARYLG